MITDNFGQCLASLLCNVGGATQGKPMTSITGVPTTQSAVAWGTISGRFGIWGSNSNSASGTPYVQLGSGLTPVARSDFKTETPLIGFEGGLFNVTNGSGYGSNIVQTLQSVGPFVTAQVVREGTVLIFSSSQNISSLASAYWAILRYNYTPLAVGAGETVAMDTTISV
jgi:hypothetical protein